MPDECRLPPGRTLRVTLVRPPLLNHLHNIAHPWATGCGACARPWTVHDSRFGPTQCERCGIEMDYDCYRRLTVTAFDRPWRETGKDTDTVPPFMCSGCRS